MNDSMLHSALDKIKETVYAYHPDGKRDAAQSVSLPSIFSLIGEKENHMFAVGDTQGAFHGYGSRSNVDTQTQRWEQGIKDIPETPEHFQAVLELLEDCFSAVPSSEEDVSLYQSIRIQTAIECARYMGKEQGAASDAPFALYTLDYSGIQTFIYTLMSKGALKALRSRSMYLTILSEYTADLVLEACGLSRANLIYTGGGKSHFLLSSAPVMIEKADEAVKRVNTFLRWHFGASLYLASGWTAAKAEAFTSDQGKAPSLSALFQETSRQISARKLRRYSYEELQEMKRQWGGDEGRECAICGQSSHLRRWRDQDLCLTCMQLERFAASLPDDYRLLCVVEGEREDGLALPSLEDEKTSLVLGDAGMARQAKRTYSINHREPGLPRTTRIYVSRYQARFENGQAKTLEDLAAASKGIRRLGVFRADVDNLGHLFAAGFVRPADKTDHPWQKCTLTHYAMLSGALTWFFQQHLDELLLSAQDDSCLEPVPKASGVSVVYAGGDDVFLIGAWNDTLNVGIRIQQAFHEYTGGSVTMSAGFGLFTDHTPVTVMADETADLESDAKQMEGKNAISLFGQQRFHWNTFRENVLDEKVGMLAELFSNMTDKGNSFLYHVLSLFRQVESDPMAVSRLAYLLARHTPSKKTGANQEQIDAFQAFVKKVYAWAIQPEENRAFQTACMIYTYLNREAQKEKEA